MQGHWYAALEATKRLGIRYIWIDALCICQDDPEECADTIQDMADIYSSAAIVVCDFGGHDEFSVGTSILLQPLSFFFNFSEPSMVRSCRKRLQTPSWAHCSWAWTLQEVSLSSGSYCNVRLLVRDKMNRSKGKKRPRLKVRWSRPRDMDNQVASLESEHSNTEQPKATLHEEIGSNPTDIDWEKAESQIKRGISCAEAGKPFEALACFMLAKDCISTFGALTTKARELYSTASMYVAAIYTTQKLPAVAQDIVIPALAIYKKLPESGRSLGVLRFTLGTIYNALGRHDESLNSYEEAKMIFEALAEAQEQELSTWKAVLNLKLAGHRVRTQKFEEAHALLQRNIDHFQAGDDTAAQAHLARALFWQSLVHEAKGSKFMAKAMHAAAKDALNAVRVARERDLSHASTSFFAEDFDEEVEFWFR